MENTVMILLLSPWASVLAITLCSIGLLFTAYRLGLRRGAKYKVYRLQ